MSKTKIIDALLQANRVLIVSHMNPDLDALCSQLAVALWCKHLGKKFSMVNHSEIPDRYKFIPGMASIKKVSARMKAQFDVAIVLDCGERKRVGKVLELIGPETKTINIDHHVSNDLFGDLNLVESHRSSTSELVYVIMKKAGVPLTKKLAMCLYIGILTDTGSFRYSNTSAETHRIVSELMQFDFSPDKIYRRIYESMPFCDFSFFAKMVGDYKTLHQDRVIYFEFDKQLQGKFSKDFDLRETTLNFLRLSDGIELIVIFSVIDAKRTRVNFRSTDKINVAQLAEKFNGGGHKRASGCMINGTVPVARARVFEEINKIFDK